MMPERRATATLHGGLRRNLERYRRRVTGSDSVRLSHSRIRMKPKKGNFRFASTMRSRR